MVFNSATEDQEPKAQDEAMDGIAGDDCSQDRGSSDPDAVEKDDKSEPAPDSPESPPPSPPGPSSTERALLCKTRKPGGSIQKMPSVRCDMCRKKTGLATRFPCRCGKVFCTVHRYPETHPCPFNYKLKGRRDLEKSMPLIEPTKITKI